MANMEDEYKDTAEEDKETSDDINYQGTSKGVSGERNSTSHKVIFVDNLPSSMDKNGFIELFRSYGIIVDVKFLKHKTGAETGYGFVEFADWEDGRKAINDLNWHMIENRNIRVSRAKPPTKKVSLTNLYVENVPKSWDDEMLRAYFSQICTITQARVLVNRKNGQSRGVGFVHCSNNDEAKNAIQTINVDNRGVGGKVDLYVKFAKISRAERKIQRQREGGCGNQDRRKQLHRMYQNKEGFQDQYQVGVAPEGKKFPEQGGPNQHGGTHYSQRSDGRDSKPKNRRPRNKNFKKRQSKGVKKSAQSIVSKREINAKESGDQHSHQSSLETSQDSASVAPTPPVLSKVSTKGMMSRTHEQNAYSEPISTNGGFSHKVIPTNPGLQVQIPTVNPQIIRIPGHDQKSNLYRKSEQMMGHIPKAVDWQNCDGKSTAQCVTTGALSKGLASGVMYPNSSYVTPVTRNRPIQYSDLNATSPYPYPWSPTIVTPTVGTPMGVGSPLPFYGNIVGSPRMPAPDYGHYANQIASPRSVEERHSFRFVGPVSPALIDCSELQSPNSRMQQNRMQYWPVSPPAGNATPSVTTPFTLQQQMPNLSINDGTSYYMNRAMGSHVAFPQCQSDAAGAPRSAMNENRVVGGGGRAIASSIDEPWGNYNKLRQYPGTEIKRDEAVSPISSPISGQGLSPRVSWPGLQSYFQTQPYSLAPTTTHIQTQQVPIRQSVVQSNIYNQSQLGVASPSNISTPTELRGRPKYVENSNELVGNRQTMKELYPVDSSQIKNSHQVTTPLSASLG